MICARRAARTPPAAADQNRQARAPVDVLAVDRLADGDGRGRCGALGSWGSVGVRFERGVRADFHPNRMRGLPGIRDTRVTVSAVLGQLAAGLTIPELVVDFPYLDRADVLGALEFAAAAVQERELPLAQWAPPPCVSLSAPTCHRRLPFLAFAGRLAIVKASIGVGSSFYTPCTTDSSEAVRGGLLLAGQGLGAV